jgi:multisubunit Na+/H+ antiporter MnhF subunit
MIAIAAIYCFGFAGLCATYRLLTGPRLPDRIAALDVALVSFMGAIAVDGARRGDTTYFALLVVIAIVGFTATVAASQFVQRRGPLVEDLEQEETKP